jgi:phage repressor protein C with HTH and peptisase S24 domain
MSEPLDPQIREIFSEMERQGRSKADLGRLLGLDSSQVTRMAGGKRRLQVAEYKKVVEWLGLAGAPHVSGGAVVPLPGLVPLFGWVGAASENRLTLADQDLRGYVPAHPAQANVRDAFALEVADVSMSPRYEPGELVYLAPNSWPKPGGDCVVVTTESEGLLKRFVRRDSGLLTLHQLNPDQDLSLELARISAIHRVVGRG